MIATQVGEEDRGDGETLAGDFNAENRNFV